MPTQMTGFMLSQRAGRTTEQPISYLMSLKLERPELISLAAGFVDYQTLPTGELAQLTQTVMSDPVRARAALQYGTTQGLPELRRVLVDHITRLDGADATAMKVTADDIVMSTGSQQLLFTITDVLVDPGDIVICERPTYFVYTAVLHTLGATVYGVDMDERGMDPGSLESLLERIKSDGNLGRIKIDSTCDYHQNPPGLTLDVDRRARILEIVERYSTDHQILILEDAAYRELTYAEASSRAPKRLPSIKSFDQANRTVALLQTFSKPFAPGLKTGYGLMPPDLRDQVLLQKGNHDFGSANFCQYVLHAAMTTGVYAEHVGRLCAHYAAKRDAMLAALEEHLGDFEPQHTHWTRPGGGMYVWLTLPRRIDTSRRSELFRRALDREVLYVPGEYCYGDAATRAAPTNTIRLSYGDSSIEQIRVGVARLADAIKA